MLWCNVVDVNDQFIQQLSWPLTTAQMVWPLNRMMGQPDIKDHMFYSRKFYFMTVLATFCTCTRVLKNSTTVPRDKDLKIMSNTLQSQLLFISYTFGKGSLAITFLLLLSSNWNVHDVCQRFFLYNQKRIFSWIWQKNNKFPHRPPL